jgi:hypothetical protein
MASVAEEGAWRPLSDVVVGVVRRIRTEDQSKASSVGVLADSQAR